MQLNALQSRIIEDWFASTNLLFAILEHAYVVARPATHGFLNFHELRPPDRAFGVDTLRSDHQEIQIACGIRFVASRRAEKNARGWLDLPLTDRLAQSINQL